MRGSIVFWPSRLAIMRGASNYSLTTQLTLISRMVARGVRPAPWLRKTALRRPLTPHRFDRADDLGNGVVYSYAKQKTEMVTFVLVKPGAST